MQDQSMSTARELSQPSDFEIALDVVNALCDVLESVPYPCMPYQLRSAFGYLAFDLELYGNEMFLCRSLRVFVRIFGTKDQDDEARFFDPDDGAHGADSNDLLQAAFQFLNGIDELLGSIEQDK